jgi:hypothetical protein
MRLPASPIAATTAAATRLPTHSGDRSLHALAHAFLLFLLLLEEARGRNQVDLITGLQTGDDFSEVEVTVTQRYLSGLGPIRARDKHNAGSI